MCKFQADLEALGLFPAGQQQALFSGGQRVGDSPPLIPRGAPWLAGDAAPAVGASPLFLPRWVDTVRGARPAGVTYRGANSEHVFQQR